jgi:hypothetical protein
MLSGLHLAEAAHVQDSLAIPMVGAKRPMMARAVIYAGNLV